MPKTGSSSIQETFARLQSDKITYTPFPSPNHCALYQYISHPSPEQYHGFRKQGLSRETIKDRRESYIANFTRFCQDLDNIGIFSAEDIAGPSTVEQLKTFESLIQRSDLEVSVIAYIRPPASYMQSIFQQSIKGGGLGQWELERLWPNYQHRIQPIDEVFGAANVELRPFHPWQFKHKSVVHDFADFIGIHLENADIVTSNESLSVEGTSLLYLQRNKGTGLEKPGLGIPKKNIQWALLLNTVGSHRFAFSEQCIQPVLKKNKQDLEWIEQRLGQSLIEPDNDSSSVVIDREDDMFDIARKCLPEIEALVYSQLDCLEQSYSSSLERCVKLLEALRALL